MVDVSKPALVSGGNVKAPSDDQQHVMKFHFRGQRYGIALGALIPSVALILLGVLMAPAIIGGNNRLAAVADVESTVYHSAQNVNTALSKGVPLSKIMADKVKYADPSAAAKNLIIIAGSCGKTDADAYTMFEKTADGGAYTYTSSTQTFRLVNVGTLTAINEVVCK